MKINFTAFLLIISILIQAQIPADLKFDKNFIESENHWVVVPNKEKEDTNFTYAFLYFDESGGGYSLQQMNDFKVENGKFVKSPEDKSGMTVVRLGNTAIQFSFLSDARITEMQLEKTPSFLKFYNSLKDEDEQKLSRASAVNGLGRSDLALPILQNLKDKSFNSAKLYFELAFAYNALKKYDDAEILVTEAEKKGFIDELLVKEKIYALVHNNKLEFADSYLKKNFSIFKTNLFKEESIVNLTSVYFNVKNYSKTEDWIAIYNQEFPQGGRYKSNVDAIKTELEKVTQK